MGGSWILSGVLEAGQCSNQETIPLDPAPTEKPGFSPSLVNLSGLYALTVLCSSITGSCAEEETFVCHYSGLDHAEGMPRRLRSDLYVPKLGRTQTHTCTMQLLDQPRPVFQGRSRQP